MSTYWQAGVSVDGVQRVSMGGDPTLSGVIGRAIKDAIYYQAIYPEAAIVIEDMREVCGGCCNDGEVTKRGPRSSKRIKCPVCKGKVPTATAEPIRLRLPENGVSLVATV